MNSNKSTEKLKDLIKIGFVVAIGIVIASLILRAVWLATVFVVAAVVIAVGYGIMKEFVSKANDSINSKKDTKEKEGDV